MFFFVFLPTTLYVLGSQIFFFKCNKIMIQNNFCNMIMIMVVPAQSGGHSQGKKQGQSLIVHFIDCAYSTADSQVHKLAFQPPLPPQHTQKFLQLYSKCRVTVSYL